MHRRISLVPLLALVLFACGRQTTTPPASNGTPAGQPAQDAVIIPDTTKVTDASTRTTLTAYDAESGVMRFSKSSPVLAKLKIGDVLVSEPSNAAPSGYLRKVQAVRQEGSEVVLDTTQARLDEAITEGELKADFQLSGDDLLRTEGLPKGVTLTATPVTGLKPQAGVGTSYNFSLNFNHTFVPIQGPNATGTIKVDGAVNFNVGYGVDVGVHFLSSPHLTFQASVGFDQSSHLNITGDFQGVVGDSVLIGTEYFEPKTFLVGFIPVVLVPKVELYLTAGGEITAHVNFAASESVTAQVGARWTSSDGWKNISGFDIKGSLTPPTFSGSLKPRVGMQSRASFTLYGVAGPEATLEAGVNLDVAYPRNPNWIVNGFMKGTVGFQAKLPFLGTLASYNATIFDISKELGRSGNAPPVLTLTSQTHSVNVGMPLNFRALCTAHGPTFGNNEFYFASDAEDGCPQISVASSKDGALTPDYTFTTPGERTITVTARDAAGATAQLSFMLNIIDPPPTLTLNYTGDAHQGTPFSISTTIIAPSEESATNFCDNSTWAVDAPDTLLQINGCQVEVMFRTTGARQVRVSTHTRLGAVASKTATFNVLPPLVNPYPKITYAGVYDRDAPRYDVPGCSTTSVFQGDTLNLTWPRIVCSGAEAGPTVFYAKVTLENPQNEALTYSWKLYVTGSAGEYVLKNSNQAVFDLFNASGQSPITTSCRITLTVSPPESSRSKSLTVWNGKCTYNYGTILK